MSQIASGGREAWTAFLSTCKTQFCGRKPLPGQTLCAVHKRQREKSGYEVETELEGTLGEVYAHDGRAQFVIFDAITNKPTTCRFKIEEAESVGALITHRIRVFGTARYSRKHIPEAIAVERWEAIGDNLPSMRELHNAGFRIRTNESSQDLIRKIRALDG